ncbi:hypothetical protein EIP86_007717 [Pleurotus ostreatoroseus]|nr:hypothetical protein EIP86_007717 [Pleurotus ostreatoroseus]
MSDATFSVVTSVYTVGGFLGSFFANVVMDRWGRKGAFAIVIGIMVTQAMGLQLATPHRWRLVLLFSAALSAAQWFISPTMVESPTWLHRHGLLQDKAAAARKLWDIGSAQSFDHLPSEESRDPLLAGEDEDPEDQRAKAPEEHHAAVSVRELLTAPELRKPLIIVCSSMLCQQLSVQKRLGRKTLLALSAGGAFLSLVGVGFGLNSGLVSLASITILTFIA